MPSTMPYPSETAAAALLFIIISAAVTVANGFIS